MTIVNFIQFVSGCTAISWASVKSHGETIQCMMSQLSAEQQLWLLSAENKEKRCPVDEAYRCNNFQAAGFLETYRKEAEISVRASMTIRLAYVLI